MTDTSNEGWLTTVQGVPMPWLIYGTAWKKERTAEFVLAAFAAGFRGIDTACQPRHYREDLVGSAIADLRQQGLARDGFYLQTKYTPPSGQDAATIPYDQHAAIASQVEQSCARSLTNLGVEYLDTLILHSPLPTLEETVEAWRAMERIQQGGGARQLGISNCYSLPFFAALHEVVSVKPAVLQNRFYPDSGYDQELRRWCRHHNVIYQSFWTLTANPHILRSPTFQRLAAVHNRTVEQIMFGYLRQSGVVPLTGTTAVKHMTEDLAVRDFSLADEDMRQIAALVG